MAKCYSVINPKEKKPDEKGILETGSCFTFRIGNLEKEGFYHWTTRNSKLNMLVVLQMKVPMMKAFINKSIQ